MSYDIIGDVHGHADKLVALLRAMGYEQDGEGWAHASRRAIFVGDLIDRGPGQLETLRIVRAMVERAGARAVMGNHEFNAIGWHTGHPDGQGGYLRTREGRKGANNRAQHEAFLAEVAHDPLEHARWIGWFRTLPLWLDLPELRVVHAVWHPGHMGVLAPRLGAGGCLTEPLLADAHRRGSDAFRAIEVLLKGVEVPLPAGEVFHDTSGALRTEVRVRWWDRHATTLRRAALLAPDLLPAIPDAPIDAEGVIGYDGDKPVFFGHYWLSGTPAPLAERIACVDYSAGKGGPLVAYRWDGERVLRADRFVSSSSPSAGAVRRARVGARDVSSVS